jgi:polysaccharide export outer membrane protein
MLSMLIFRFGKTHISAQLAWFALLGFGALLPRLGAQSPNVPASIDQSVSPGVRPPVTTAPAITSVPEDFPTARLVPGYLLQLEIFNAPEMDAELRVDEQGNLNVPLLGPVHVAGQSVAQAETTISKALVAGDILINPQVTLNVLQYTSGGVTVLGEVLTPGRLPILAPKNLADVLALAGGELISAGNQIEVRHGSSDSGDVERVHYAQGSSPDALRTHLVYPGDTVFVRRAGIIYVLGAVNRPGGYFMINGGSLNVLQAVSLAYGTTNVASLETVRLLRQTDDGKFSEIAVPFSKVTKGKAPPMSLQPEDILYVPTSGWKNILINGSAIIGTTASAAIYRVP